MGVGSYGVIYKTCCLGDKDCDFVTKIQSLYSLPDGQRWFKREIKFQNEISELGLGIPVIDFWIGNDGKYYSVMERLNKTAKDLLREYKTLRVRSIIIGKLFKLITNLHSHGYYHNDLSLVNIMVKYDEKKYMKLKKVHSDEFKLYKNINYVYYFIDLQSMYIENDFDEFEIEDNEEAERDDYEQFINSLKSQKLGNIHSVIYFLESYIE